MWRRKFIAGLAGTVAFSLAARAQTPNRIYRLGHLANSADSEAFTRQTTLPELARLGFVEGRNLVFDARVGEPDLLPALMRELLIGQPDAVVAIGPALRPAGAATRTVPLVAFGNDPTELGLAASYARPGGNVTGVVILIGELEAKRLSILLEAVPDRRRVAALVPTQSLGQGNEAALRKAATASNCLYFRPPHRANTQAPLPQCRRKARRLWSSAQPRNFSGTANSWQVLHSKPGYQRYASGRIWRTRDVLSDMALTA